jgi:radical SAM protein with 4Fe4S-binding SPASM domain
MKKNSVESQSKIKDMSLDLFDKVCSQSREMGTREINIIGYGEPFLHPEFGKILPKAKERGATVRVVTNGTLINETIIPALINSRLDTLQVSLWAHSRENYIRNYPGINPDMFQHIVGGLQRLVEEKKKRKSYLPKLIMHTPISKKNYNTIEEIVDFAKQIGFDSLSFTPLRNWKGKLSSLALSLSEEKQTIQSLQKIKKALNRLSISHNIERTVKRFQIGEAVLNASSCYVGWTHIRVRVDGTVVPCCLFPIGNLKEKSLKEIWNGPRIQQFRKNMLTRTNLTEILSQGKCGYCGHVIENEKIERMFRWFRPFIDVR